MTSLPHVIRAAAGLLVAQRDARAGDPADLRVGAVAHVVLPESAPLAALGPGGVLWRRHWDESDRLVIEFIDTAVVEVDEHGLITFDRELTPEVEQHLLLDHVLPLVLARAGHLVLHGALISLGGAGVALVGSSGAGKSTLTAFAWQRGWTVGGDDGVVVQGSPPTAEPTYPTIRLSASSMQLLEIDPLDAEPIVGKFRIDGSGPSGFDDGQVDLALIVVLEPVGAGASARFEPMNGMLAHAELFGSTFHADLATRRLLPAVVDELADVIDTTRVGRLAVPRDAGGLDSSELLLRRMIEDGSSVTPARNAG